MSSYTISNKQLNPSRVFILQKRELEKRLDKQKEIAKHITDNSQRLNQKLQKSHHSHWTGQDC